MTSSTTSSVLPSSDLTESAGKPFENQAEDKIISRCARRIANDVLHLKAGENVAIEAWEHDLQFAKEVALEARKAGANALLILESDDNYFRLVEGGFGKTIGRMGTHEWALVEKSDAYIFFPGPADIQRQSKLSDVKRNDSTAYNREWYTRTSKAGLRGVRVRTSYATPSRADMMGLDVERWRRNLLDAIDVDYNAIDRLGKSLAKKIARGRIVRVTSPGGTDVAFKTSNVPPHLYSGVVRKPTNYNIYSALQNIPGSELDTAPKSGSGEGTIFFDRRVYSESGWIEGLRWTLKGGKLIDYSAEKNLNLFSSDYKKAKGDKNLLGVMILGLTPRLEYGFGAQDLYVEGAVTIGVGAFGEGDRNKTEYQFYGTMSEATVEIDGKVVVDQGSIQSSSG